MVPESFGAALRELRVQQGWSLRHFADSVHYSPAYLSEIERGIKRPTAEVARRCDDALDASGLLAARAAVEDHAPPRPPTSERIESLAQMPVTVTEVAMAAAHESTSSAADDGAQNVPTMSVEQVQHTAVQLARGYHRQPLLSTLLAARTLRDLARRMAEATRKPRQTGDLYQVAGQACGIMSVASFDLAIWPAATEQARAALVYADLIDDASLRSWAHGTLALTAYWSGDPREAGNYAARGLLDAPAGTPRARLHGIAARAWSHLGDADRARSAIEDAARERQTIGMQGDDALYDGVGGEFGWGPARQAMCDASTWLRLGQADEAAASAREAIRLRRSDDTGNLVDVKASIDLAAAELLRGRLDAVVDVLAPVWEVGSEFRGHGLVARLDNVSAHLQEPRYREAPEARTLMAQIEAFAAESAPRALPPGSDQLD